MCLRPVMIIMLNTPATLAHLLCRGLALAGGLVELCGHGDIGLGKAQARDQGGNARRRQLLHNVRRQVLALHRHRGNSEESSSFGVCIGGRRAR